MLHAQPSNSTLSLPHNQEAECATLGALFVGFSVEVLGEVQQILSHKDFYTPLHGLIFKTISELAAKGSAVDPLTVGSVLTNNPSFKNAGGLVLLSNLSSRVPSSANVTYYAELVRDCSVRRELIRVAEETKKQAYDLSQEARVAVETAEKNLFAINNDLYHGQFFSVQPLIRKATERIETLMVKKGKLSGVPCGIRELDRLTDGFQPSEMIIIGARPSVGKTALALSFASHMAIRKNIPVGFFTLEMSGLSLVLRLLSSEAHVNSAKVRSGLLTPAEFKKILEVASRMYDAPLFIEDTPNIRLLDLRAQARRMVSNHKIKILFIDYLSLITTHARGTIPRHEQVAEISQSLKALARELDIPVVALSQVGRQTEGKTPSLADLRESGALEQDADVVIFLHRDRENEEENEESFSGKVKAKLIVAKQRNGPTGIVDVLFWRQTTRFVNRDSSRMASSTP